MLDYEENNKQIDSLLKENNVLSDSIKLLEKEKSENESQIKSVNSIIAEHSSNLRMANEKKRLIKTGQCPTCGQHTSNIGTIESLGIDSIRLKLEEQKQLLEELTKNGDDITQQILDKKATIKQNDSKVEQLEKKVFETNGSEYEEKMYEIDKKIDNFEKTLLDLDKKIEQTEKELSTFVDTVDSSEIQKNILDLHKKIETSNNMKNLVKSNREQEELIKEKEAEIISEEATLKTLNSDKSVFDEAYNILDKTLPLYMIKKVCDKLENEINGFVQTIFDKYQVFFDVTKKGCEFLYTKDLNVKEQKFKNNHLLNAKMSSGFEKALLTMSFKTALLKSYGINIFIGDEIDGAADEDSSLQLFSNLLNNSYFDQVFLISHKKNICQSITSEASDTIVYFANNGQFTSAVRVD